jgi:predicted nucleotidyltransferase
LDISTKIDKELQARISEVAEVLDALKIPFLVVGASARDLFFHYGYDMPVKRGTKDVDFAIQVPNWEAFGSATDGLIGIGFENTKHAHRLTKDGIYPIDVVPFGAIAENNTLEWPPNYDFQMNVLGFREAIDDAIEFKLCRDPEIKVRVASPAGLSLMKLIAWTDRPAEKRTKDASDLKFIIESLERLPIMSDRIFDIELLDKYEGDLLVISSHVLGEDVGKIISEESRLVLAELYKDNIALDYLAREMGRSPIDDEEINYHLIDAFFTSIVD